MCVQKHAFGQEGHGVQRSLHVLAGDSLQRSAAAAAGAREPPERPHLLLLTPRHGPDAARNVCFDSINKLIHSVSAWFLWRLHSSKT